MNQFRMMAATLALLSAYLVIGKHTSELQSPT